MSAELEDWQIMDLSYTFQQQDEIKYIDSVQLDMDLDEALTEAVKSVLAKFGVNVETQAGECFWACAVEPSIDNAVTIIGRAIRP